MRKETLLSSMPKLILAVVLIVCIGAVVGLMGYVLTKKQTRVEAPEVKTPDEIVEDEIADWQTYRNEEFGFEFQYPKDWENVSSSHLVISQNQMIEILIFPNKELSLEQWVEKFFQKNCEKMVIGNNENVIKCLSDDQFSTNVFLSLEDVKILSVSCLKISDNQSDNQQDCTDEINQILSTFKFIEK